MEELNLEWATISAQDQTQDDQITLVLVHQLEGLTKRPLGMVHLPEVNPHPVRAFKKTNTPSQSTTKKRFQLVAIN